MIAEYGKGRDFCAAYDSCVLVLGSFDGVHKGHATLIEQAKKLRLPLAIMTIYGKRGEPFLFDRSEREKAFEAVGADIVYSMDFDDCLRNTSAEDFLKCVLCDLPVKAFVCGTDFRFGSKAQGTPALIRSYTGLPVYEKPLLFRNGEKISSSHIRSLLGAGDLEGVRSELAEEYGVRFSVTNTVLSGRRLGRTIGFPTANMRYPEGKAEIAEGVYGVTVYAEGGTYRGIANVGRIPTFGIAERSVETYIDGFCGDLYGKRITVEFDFFIRPIVQFDGAEGLKAQLCKDVQRIR